VTGLTRHRRAAFAGIALVLGIPWQPVRAGVPGTPFRVAACIRATAAGRPWLEKTLWGLFDQERGWVGAEIANHNGTYDLGPLQVNSSWVPTVAVLLHRDVQDVRRWIRDDACFNVGTAAWLFLSAYSNMQDYWKAVGAYHSPNPSRGRRYAINVGRHLQRRYGSEFFAELRLPR
jgi:hypothetical protein